MAYTFTRTGAQIEEIHNTVDNIYNTLGNSNLLSNHNFLIQTPDDSQPLPSATPTSYPPGYQIFSGVFANETTGISNLTYIDGRVSFSGGDLYFAVPNTGGLERLNADQFVASVADFDGKPRTRGVSFALVGNEYRVTVGIDALSDGVDETLLGSVKFEQGKVATGHEVYLNKSKKHEFSSVSSMKQGDGLNVNLISSNGVLVSTLGYYGGWASLIEPQGSAEYILTTLQAVRDAKGDQLYAPDGYFNHYLFGGTTYVAMIQHKDVVNVLTGGAKKDLSEDSYPVFQAAYYESVVNSMDLFIPSIDNGGYFLSQAVLMNGTGTSFNQGIKVNGGGQFNSLGNAATIIHPKENSAFITSEVADSFDNLCFKNWAGAFGVEIQSVDTAGKSLILASNPWSLSGGTPVTWDHTINSTDGTPYSNFIQFSAFGSWVSDTITVNGNGTVTISNIKGANGTLDSDFLNPSASQVNEFVSYAHFESVPIDGNLTEQGSIHLDIAENGHFSRLWFPQVRKCFSHDLGSGSGPNSGRGNLGLFSNIIVDGANDFMTGMDLTGPSQENLHGGQFVNIQFFSCRRAFNGRRLENLSFSNCVHNFSETLFRSNSLYNVQWVGGQIGWGTGTGFIENVVDISNQCFGLSITGTKWGRHNTGNVLKLVQAANINLSGNIHQSVSETGGAGNEFLIVESELKGSYFGNNSISTEISGVIKYLTMDLTGITSQDSIAGTVFADPVQAFGANQNIADMSSVSPAYAWMHTYSSVKDGGSVAVTDINDNFSWKENKNTYKYSGSIPTSKVLTIPHRQSFPLDTSVILDFSGLSFTNNIEIRDASSALIYTVSSPITLKLYKFGPSWIAS